MSGIAEMLTPPSECQANGNLTMRDKRKGSIWYCPHARKITGKGRKRPACLCKAALDACRSALGQTEPGEQT